MNKIKKKIFFVLKTITAILVLLTVVLFFYAAFFFEPISVEKKIVEDKIIEEEKPSEIKKESEEELNKTKEQKPIKIKTDIKDGIFATVGNKAITRSDIINEIKIILILANKSFSEDERKKLQQMAIKSMLNGIMSLMILT